MRSRRAPGRGWRLGLLAPLLLVGCGFHLRGAIEIPPNLSPLYIEAGGLVGGAIEGRLQGSAVRLTDKPAEAGLRLRILSQARDSRVVAVDSDGKALAFQQTYEIAFEAVDAAGATLLPPQTVTLDRTFDDNPNVSVLGKEQESDIIYQDLIDDAADQILLRLRAALAAR